MIIEIMFYDRDEELDALRREYDAEQFSFVVIYGRRRVGKTELIREFCSDRPHAYHLVSQNSETVQREKLVNTLAEFRDDRVPRVDDWDDVIEYLGDVLSSGRCIVAIDEFPYLVDSNEAILSAFQRLVDEYVRETESMLVLCGSSIGVMESEVLGHESPLYGRRTAQIDVEPFSFADALTAIDYDFEESIRSFATTGGMPMYLTLFDYDRPLAENVLGNHLSKTSVLYNEPEFLLRTELRNPARYMSILEAVANGYTTPNEISGQTDIDSGPLSTYLQRLRQLRLIDREVPVTAAEKKSKRPLYRLDDDFLRFWFRFVEPNRAGIEHAPEAVFENRIVPQFDGYVAETFENICREALWRLSADGELASQYASVGRWWYGEDEIDVVGLNDREPAAVFGECKWTNTPVGRELVADLRAKVDEVRWKSGERDEEYVLFSKSGFDSSLADELGPRWHLYDLERLSDAFVDA